jgi:hypothetical protein
MVITDMNVKGIFRAVISGWGKGKGQDTVGQRGSKYITYIGRQHNENN